MVRVGAVIILRILRFFKSKRYKNRKGDIKKARLQISYLTGDEETKRMQWLEEKWEMDRASEVSYAKEEEIKETQINTEKELLKMNMKLKDIITVTKLTKEEIEKIKSEM